MIVVLQQLVAMLKEVSDIPARMNRGAMIAKMSDKTTKESQAHSQALLMTNLENASATLK
jgi:hypothetical protein